MATIAALLSLAGCNFALPPTATDVAATTVGSATLLAMQLMVPPTDNASEADIAAPAVIATEPAETDGGSAQSITTLPLGSPYDRANFEYSGLAWYGDRLVLLPQFPNRLGNMLPTYSRDDILSYLRGESQAPLEATPIGFDDGGLPGMVPGFEGYEAIAFDGNYVYLTAETRPGDWMLGYLIPGVVTPTGDLITLAPSLRAPAPAQADLMNMGDEALVIDGERLLTIYEANGVAVNSQPMANVFTRSSVPVSPIPFPNIDYRITDATDVDSDGRFWAINYFYPGDAEKLLAMRRSTDAESVAEGQESARPVERLVEFQIDEGGIRTTDSAPVNLKLSRLGLPRNWEGIVRLNVDEFDGFLLVTDRYPDTILAYVPRPATE